MSNATPKHLFTVNTLIGLTILIVVFAVTAKGLSSPELEGIDGAHHVMDGIFFHDFFVELPRSVSVGFVFDYYKHYPALGFIFWPPLFPFVEGIVFLLGEISLFSAQISILLFAGLLAICMYRISRYYFTPSTSLAATLTLICLPGLYQYFNVVMLEIPTLAMMALTALLYLHTVNHPTRHQSYQQWQLLAFVAAMSLYTKQTAFILFPAIVCDLVVNHRQLLRLRPLWSAVISTMILLLPLALFTLKFGKANIEQSIGQNTQLIMKDFHGMERWSLSNWLYYAKTFPATVSYPVLLLALAEIIGSLFCLSRLKQNTLWIAWLSAFYLFFSYFDNKSERFATLAAIPLVMLAIGFIWRTFDTSSIATQLMRNGLSVLIIAISIWAIYPKPLATLSGIHAIMDNIDLENMDGNIAYIGRFRQPFIYDIRLKDHQRKHYVLKGDDIFTDAQTLSEQLYNYRIRYIFIAPQGLSKQESDIVNVLQNQATLTQVMSKSFKDQSTDYALMVLKNNGVLGQKMHAISLSSKLIN